MKDIDDSTGEPNVVRKSPTGNPNQPTLRPFQFKNIKEKTCFLSAKMCELDCDVDG